MSSTQSQGSTAAATSNTESSNGSVQTEQFISVADTIVPTGSPAARPHVVIIGGGFAGLNAAKGLADAAVDVTLIDRRNHHLFAPLLYQVASAQLSPANIAQPIRVILRRQKNLGVLLGDVESIDVEDRRLSLADGTELKYDYLVVAVGATHSYFGHDEWAPLAPGLKTIEDALTIRRRILLAFERAEKERDRARHDALLTFVVVGGGPTGVEMAGAIGELARHTLTNDFDHIDSREATIILLEGLPRILPMFSESLSRKAEEDLKRFNVITRANSLVTAIDDHGVNIGDERIDAATVIWAAGVQVSPLTRTLSSIAELDRAGRVTVEPELHISGYPEIFVVGDAASVTTSEGMAIPGIAPAAIQEGKWVAENIKRAVTGMVYQPFAYADRGSMATIGRNHAVAEVRGHQFSGFPAWVLWAVVHIAYLVGLRNRLLVFAQWLFSYLSYSRGARLITGDDEAVKP